MNLKQCGSGNTHCYEAIRAGPYDFAACQVITHGAAREQATELMRQALSSARIDGVHTTVPLHQAVLSHDDFRAGRVTTRWLENEFLPAW